MNTVLFQTNMGLLGDVFQQFIATMPRATAAVAILLVGFLLSKTISRITKKLLENSGIDKFGEKLNEIDFLDSMNFKVVISNILSTLLYYLLVLIFLMASTDVLGMPAVSNLVSSFINYVPKLLFALGFFAIGLFVADFIKKIVFTTCNSLGIPSAKVISTFLFYFMFIMIAISALEQAQMNTDFIKSNLSLILGGVVIAFGLGYGLASKDVVSSFLSSVYNRGKFEVGDIIQIGSVKGKVVQIDTTSITIYDGQKRIIVPMSRFTTEEVYLFDQEEGHFQKNDSDADL